jgi:hypothetical protein
METIDRQNPDNINLSNTTFDFYNDKTYEAVENAKVEIIYDAVPKEANAQEIINKNILCYGKLKEGFDNLDKYDLDVTLTPSEVEIEVGYEIDTIVRDNVAEGDITEDWVIDGDSGEIIYLKVIDVSDYVAWGVVAGTVWQITADGIPSSGVLSADDVSTMAKFLEALSYIPVLGASWVYTYNVGAGTITIGNWEKYATISVSRFYTPTAESTVSKYSGFKTGAIHPFCIYYYDEALRRGDAQVGDGMSVYVPMVTELGVSTVNYRQKISWAIGHTPPSWAKYYRFGYAGNTLCSYFIQYICSDITDADSAFNYRTSIDITPLQTLKTTEESTWNQFPNSIIDPYVWEQGDRVRIITVATDAGEGDILGAPVSGVYDYEILQYDATSNKIIIQATTIKATLGVGINTLIEIYRPVLVGQKTVYYEFGQLLSVIGGYHMGTTQNQTAVLDATGVFNAGDIYHISRTPSKPLDSTSTKVGAFHESAWYSDFYLSEEWSKGKIGFESNIGEVDLNIIRFSNQYLQNTRVNGLSTFDALDYKELNELYGDIKFMVEQGDTLKVYQAIKACSIPIGRTEYTDASGNTSILKSNLILGATRYSFTNYGTVYPTSITQNNRYIYGFDIYNGIVWRDSANGLFPISGRYESADAGGDYKMQTYFKEKAKALLTSGISNTLVQTVFDEEYKLLYVIFTDTTTPANNDVVAYHEPSNRWISFYDLKAPINEDYPCWVQSLGMSFLSFIPTQGDMTTTEAEGVATSAVWRHNSDSVDRCSFYGQAQDCVVGVIANQNGGEIKVLDSIEIHSNALWSVVVEAEANLNYPYGMYSIIPKTKFKKREGILMSEFMRNGYTTSGTLRTLDYLNGEELRCYAAKVTLTNDSTSKVTLLMVNINMSNSKV